MAGDIGQECLHHDRRRDERHHEADRYDADVIDRHLAAVLVEIIGERADHGRDREKERELRRRALVAAEQHRRHDAGAGARYAGDHRDALRDADPQIHHQRIARGVVLMRLEIELIDPQEDRAADDQRETHHPRIEQELLDVFADSQADDHRRQERHQHADDKSPVVRIGEHAKRDARQLDEIQHDDCENRPELNQDHKALPEGALAKAEEALRQQHVTCR